RRPPGTQASDRRGPGAAPARGGNSRRRLAGRSDPAGHPEPADPEEAPGRGDRIPAARRRGVRVQRAGDPGAASPRDRLYKGGRGSNGIRAPLYTRFSWGPTVTRDRWAENPLSRTPDKRPVPV